MLFKTLQIKYFIYIFPFNSFPWNLKLLSLNLLRLAKENTTKSQNYFQTTIKKVKQQNLRINSYHLANLEKFFIYIHEAIGSDPKQIATSIDRDSRSINTFLKNTKESKDAFLPQHHKKSKMEERYQ